jgi:hypothetical protein
MKYDRGWDVNTSQSLSYFIELPMKMEPIECSETSTISTQTPGKYPKENILHIKDGESLKSRILLKYLSFMDKFHSNTVDNK